MYSPKELNRAKLFSEAKEIIAACAAFPIRLAVASRSPTPKTASAFLKKLGGCKAFTAPLPSCVGAWSLIIVGGDCRS